MAKNISQDELALLAGVERAYVGHIERGKKNPTVLTLNKLANALNCDVRDFFNIHQGESEVGINLRPGRKTSGEYNDL